MTTPKVWTIEEVRNAKSLNEENTDFDLEIKHPDFGWIPYTLHPDDPDGSVSNEELLSMMGSNYAQYVPPTSEEIIQTQTAAVRFQRDMLLKMHVDAIVSNNLRWTDMGDAERTKWTDYRQALLDIPEQSGFPQNVTWPTVPEGYGLR
ncbi:tail fibre assembly protein [uncultured Mediterranean phage uvMED]|nr:tail fibre assembly protein [uncultured Mediterranean phage uvMED]BAR19728.1 tail fibre assembly protein [uncultured Mediterranean phage uvMED]BAR19777.1 tail fibre assembly protein [uncultured Mediterranean phage uvMED]